MIFRKETPTEWGYYWVIDLGNIDPVVAFFWRYHEPGLGYINNLALPRLREEKWIGESKHYRFGDKIEKPRIESVE